MALPLPGSPSASWATFRERLKHTFSGADPRVCIAFWLFGLINNVLYVIILSAALDLVGPSIPKGVVLLADVIPSFLTKLLAPYFIHVIPYDVRVLIFVALSAAGMLLIALTPSYTDPSNIPGGDAGTAGNTGIIAVKLFGVMLASLSSGGGELSFVGMVHYYGPFSLAAWGSGTGGAGLVGAGLYAVMTTGWGISVKSTLLASAFLPVVMLVSFFVVLPRGPLLSGSGGVGRDGQIGRGLGGRDGQIGRGLGLGGEGGGNRVDNEEEEREGLLDEDQDNDTAVTDTDTQIQSRRTTPTNSTTTSNAIPTRTTATTLRHNLHRARALFLPYMLPLLLVYIAEYTINQGVSPTLLFPLPSTPFTHYRAFYPTYNAIYQVGVFLSRSSTPFFRIHNLYNPSLLQCLNLFILILQSLFDFIPSVYIVFAIVFWEGLLGGLVYVNTFAEISEKVQSEDREFSLSATTVSDSGGICVAGLVAMGLEVWLCERQVRGGREWCRML